MEKLKKLVMNPFAFTNFFRNDKTENFHDIPFVYTRIFFSKKAYHVLCDIPNCIYQKTKTKFYDLNSGIFRAFLETPI